MSRALVGTSGWSYPSWRPGFYPDGTAPSDFLGVYASRLPAVELNATKYRLPSEEQFRTWAAAVPDGFRFAVKAPPRVESRLETFQTRVRALGDRLVDDVHEGHGHRRLDLRDEVVRGVARQHEEVDAERR